MVAVVEEQANVALIPEFFAGRSVFITGGTGFMGKVLVERLLSTCPDVGPLYLLVRHKRDVPPEKRLLELKNSQALSWLRARAPRQLDKLRLVAGDAARPLLALSASDLAQLQQVSVIFNCVASVRFSEPLRVAAESNALSALHVCRLAARLPALQVLVHVSTAFVCPETEEVSERPARTADPRAALAAALALPDDTSPTRLRSIIAPKPNTYTYTKMLAEALLADLPRQHYKLAIFRPTIVVSSVRSPAAGWVEGRQGATAAVAAIARGALRVFPCRARARALLLPVDLAIHTLIAVAWDAATHYEEEDEVPVYNCSTDDNATTWERLRHATVTEARRHPPAAALAYPACLITERLWLYNLLTFILQTVPLYMTEYIARIFSNKKNRTNLVEVERRLRQMSGVLAPFTRGRWRVRGERVRRLRARLAPADAARLRLDPQHIRWDKHHADFVRGCRVYLGQESDADLPQSRQRLRRLLVVQSVSALALGALLLWAVSAAAALAAAYF